MMTLGFENYSDALRIYLAKYREVSTDPAPSSNPISGLARS
jgi:hypothetical protein